jgi:hypothetical protein
VNLQNDDVGLSGKLQLSFKHVVRMSSEGFESFICLVGPAVTKKSKNFFRSTVFHKLLEDCSLHLSQNCVLPGREVIPHVFVADDTFP